MAIVLEPVKIGTEFIDWPLHLTIVPWFPCDDEKKLDDILSAIAESHSGFTIEAGDVDYFGPQKDVKVNLVKDNPKLAGIHWDVFNNLEKNGFGIHQKNYVGDGYMAHITHQQRIHANPGDKFAVKGFTLVKQVRQKKTGTMIKELSKEYFLR